MTVVIIPSLDTAPIIDAVANNDFLLIGDASDTGKIKRVLIESLPAPPTGYQLLSTIPEIDFYRQTTANKSYISDPACGDYCYLYLPKGPTLGDWITVSSANPLIQIHAYEAGQEKINYTNNISANPTLYSNLGVNKFASLSMIFNGSHWIVSWRIGSISVFV